MWTEKQGQYLAFIHNYSKIHGRSPAESDLEIFQSCAAYYPSDGTEA
jgi:hypothetical protein